MEIGKTMLRTVYQEHLETGPFRVSLPGHQGRSEPPCSGGPSALGSDDSGATPLGNPQDKARGETACQPQ